MFQKRADRQTDQNLMQIDSHTPGCFEDGLIFEYANLDDWSKIPDTDREHINNCPYCSEEYRECIELVQLQREIAALGPISSNEVKDARNYIQVKRLDVRLVLGFLLCWKVGSLFGGIPEGSSAKALIKSMLDWGIQYAFVSCFIFVGVLMIASKVLAISAKGAINSILSLVRTHLIVALFIGWVAGLCLRASGSINPAPTNTENYPFLKLLIIPGAVALAYFIRALLTAQLSRWKPIEVAAWRKREEIRFAAQPKLLDKWMTWSLVAMAPIAFSNGFRSHSVVTLFTHPFVLVVVIGILLHIAYLVLFQIGWQRWVRIISLCWPEILYGFLFNSSYAIIHRVNSGLRLRLRLRRDSVETGTSVGGAFSHGGSTVYLVALTFWAYGNCPNLAFVTFASLIVGCCSILCPGTPHAGFIMGNACLWLLSLTGAPSPNLVSVLGLLTFDILLARFRTLGNMFSQFALACELHDASGQPMGSAKKQPIVNRIQRWRDSYVSPSM